MPQDTTHIRQFFEGIRDERGFYRNTATRIGTAFLLLLNYLMDPDAPFIRKDQEDTTQYLLRLLGGAIVGDDKIHLNADGTINCGSITASLEGIFKNLRFSEVLKSDGASVGENGTGIWMDASTGTITTDGLEVRGWMRVAKLVYNMIQVMEQDYQFSGGGDIERVEINNDGTWTLHFHKEKEGRHISFADFDILYGKMDEQPEPGGAYQYWTSWMRVCENGVTLNDGMTPDTVHVELWDDNMVPGGKNFGPKKMMTVAKRGNTQDASRQSFWELSTTDERITYYWHVDQPILRADNYALCLGILPTILDTAGVLPDTRDPRMPSLYVNTIFYENAHHIYYPSQVVKIDRGIWVQNPPVVYTGLGGTYTPDESLSDEHLAAEVAAGRMTAADAAMLKVIRTWGGSYVQGQSISEPYHFESFTRNMWLTYRLSPANASLTDERLLQKMKKEWHVDKETSRVWYYGALWECLVEGTTEEPGISTHWTMISGQALRVDFYFSRGTMVWLDDVHLLSEARILIGAADVTDDLLAKVEAGELDVSWTWERMAYEDGTQTAADVLWQPVTQEGHPNILVIDHRLNDPTRRTDCGPLWESEMRVWFRCTVRLSTGEMAEGEMGMGQI